MVQEELYNVRDPPQRGEKEIDPIVTWEPDL